MTDDTLEDFDAPRELSFLLRNNRCSASQSNDLDGLASSIKMILFLIPKSFEFDIRSIVTLPLLMD